MLHVAAVNIFNIKIAQYRNLPWYKQATITWDKTNPDNNTMFKIKDIIDSENSLKVVNRTKGAGESFTNELNNRPRPTLDSIKNKLHCIKGRVIKTSNKPHCQQHLQ